jgi:hypothetical protein
MKIIDRIALNRLIIIMTSFIIKLFQIFAPKTIDDIDVVKPKRKKILPWKNK